MPHIFHFRCLCSRGWHLDCVLRMAIPIVVFIDWSIEILRWVIDDFLLFLSSRLDRMNESWIENGSHRNKPIIIPARNCLHKMEQLIVNTFTSVSVSKDFSHKISIISKNNDHLLHLRNWIHPQVPYLPSEVHAIFHPCRETSSCRRRKRIQRTALHQRRPSHSIRMERQEEYAQIHDVRCSCKGTKDHKGSRRAFVWYQDLWIWIGYHSIMGRSNKTLGRQGHLTWKIGPIQSTKVSNNNSNFQ